MRRRVGRVYRREPDVHRLDLLVALECTDVCPDRNPVDASARRVRSHAQRVVGDLTLRGRGVHGVGTHVPRVVLGRAHVVVR